MRIDAAALRVIADRFDSIAQSLAGAARVRPGFGGATAGRAYVPDGDALRRGLDRRADELTDWARASGEIAVGLRCGAAGYAESDRGLGDRIG